MVTILCALLSWLIDQASKFWILAFFQEHSQSFPIIPSVFHLTFVQNTGIAFGLFQEHPRILLTAILFSVFFLMVYLVRLRETRTSLCLAYGLIIGGALGNITDRLRLGWVVDFLDFRVWPVFNLADSFITVGVAIIVLDILFTAKHNTPLGGTGTK